jgi:hypothetical protein
MNSTFIQRLMITPQGEGSPKNKSANTDITMPSSNYHSIERLKDFVNIRPSISRPYSRDQAIFVRDNVIELFQVDSDP